MHLHWNGQNVAAELDEVGAGWDPVEWGSEPEDPESENVAKFGPCGRRTLHDFKPIFEPRK